MKRRGGQAPRGFEGQRRRCLHFGGPGMRNLHEKGKESVFKRQAGYARQIGGDPGDFVSYSFYGFTLYILLYSRISLSGTSKSQFKSPA
jgi:hypothetical protein